MEKGRFVNTNFWRDTYITELDPTEKLLFLYLLTNPSTTLAGVYEISTRQIAFDTGIDRDMVQRIIERFERDGKMNYERGWLVLRNFIKHQRLNPSIRKGVQRAVAQLPDWLQQRLVVVETPTTMTLTLSELDQSVPSLYPVSPQDKISKDKISKDNLKVIGAKNAPEKNDRIAQLFYQVIKAYGLSNRNNRNTQNAIKKLKAEGTDKDNVTYLEFLLHQFHGMQYRYKPELHEALDVYAKRNKIIESVKRAASEQNKSKNRTVVVR